MSGRVTIRLPIRRGGRSVPAAVADVAAGAPDARPPTVPARIPRVARVLALAHHWRGLMRSGAVRDQADLARLVGVSRARVTQVMSLLWLAPDIQECILLMPSDHVAKRSGLERSLRNVAAMALWATQHRCDRALEASQRELSAAGERSEGRPTVLTRG